ncbi:uncharacterized protein TNCT_473891 [Trichonephila clavata]|uniref:Uncharacterized protein n=1 Tax=Trichonephila clavata TaxID=2740835 RepID=A0A8X6LCE8_TRICU|nr:uncharacterized protein TNCT_473891 [Trichonephila clavata]
MKNYETSFHSNRCGPSSNNSPNTGESLKKTRENDTTNNLTECQIKRQYDRNNDVTSVQKRCNTRVEHREVALDQQIERRKTQTANLHKDESQVSRKSTDTKNDKLHFSNSINNNDKNIGNLCSCASVAEAEDNETLVKELQDHIQALNIELNNWKSENQLLKRDILRAKNVVKREMGGKVESFDDLVKMTDEDGWIGQQEMILLLKKELHELNEIFKEKGIQQPSPVRRKRSILPEEIPDDRKIHWRLKIERDDVIRHAEKEKQDLIEARDKLKEKVESVWNRNEEMEQQINSIREELSQRSKIPNSSLIYRLREMEKRMKFYLKDKHELRRALEEEELKGNNLLHKIADLQNESVSQKNTLNVTEETLENQKNDEEKFLCPTIMSEFNSTFGLGDLKENLYEMDEEYEKKMEFCNSLSDLIFRFEEFYADIKLRSSLHKDAANSKSSRTSISTDTFDGINTSQYEYIDQDIEKINTDTLEEQGNEFKEQYPDHFQNITRNYSFSEEFARNTVDENQEQVVNEFIRSDSRSERERLASSFESIEKRISEKTEQVYDLLDNIKHQTEQLLNSYSQLWKIVTQIKMMMYKYKRLKKLSKYFEKKSDSKENVFCHDACAELFTEGGMVLNILRKENKFLKMLINSVFGSKAYDFDLFCTYAEKSKELFYAEIKT